VDPPRPRFALWPAGLIVLLVVVLDQVTKLLVRSRFELYDSLQVVPGFFSLTRVHNYGAAFGMLNSAGLPYQAAILTAVRIAALVGLAWFASTIPAVDGFTLGYVVDFFDFYWRGWHFWAFNVADASITVGMALIILDQIGVGRHRVSETV
jgi:signal peptidase II